MFELGNPAELDFSDLAIVVLLIVSSVVALMGVAAAAYVYLYKRVEPERVEPELLQNAWYIDTGVSAFMGGPGYRAFDATATADQVGIDGALNGVGRVTRWSGGRLRLVQNGYVRAYALMIAIGAVLLAAWVLTRVTAW